MRLGRCAKIARGAVFCGAFLSLLIGTAWADAFERSAGSSNAAMTGEDAGDFWASTLKVRTARKTIAFGLVADTDVIFRDSFDGNSCTANQTRACYSGAGGTAGVGSCSAGIQYCVDGLFGPCTGEVTPSAESCNGRDDDCDGSSDNGLGTITCGVGACQQTTAACSSGSPGTCTPGIPTRETCGDGIDNNCNEVIDEGCA